MARDTKQFHVIEAPHSFNHKTPPVIGRRAAYAAAMALGDRIAIYEWEGRHQHWTLILDRTIPQEGQMPKRAHVRNVLGVVIAP